MTARRRIAPSSQAIFNAREVVCNMRACYTYLDVTTQLTACAALDYGLLHPGNSAQQRYFAVLPRPRTARWRGDAGDTPADRRLHRLSNERQHPQQQTAMNSSLRRNLVLIVEDEAPIAEALTLIVEDAGYTAITAAHGKEALALAKELRPKLVITDLMMPHLNGIDFIAALRAHAEATGTESPPTVLMTAAGPARAREAGADAVLRKPFDITEIEALLRRFLGPADPT